MAIDTAAKRSSVLDYEEEWTTGTPLPDGTISQADRQHIAWSYSGILASAPVVTGTGAIGPLIGPNRLLGGS